MSNELNNIISRTTDGVYEGVAIGGDRYPGTTFMDHVMRYQENPDVKMLVVLGEVRVCVSVHCLKVVKLRNYDSFFGVVLNYLELQFGKDEKIQLTQKDIQKGGSKGGQ